MRDLFRHTNLTRAGLCALVIMLAPAAPAQDVTALRDSAYCVGALRHSSGRIAWLGPVAATRHQTERLAQRAVLVGAAISRHDIDAGTTRHLIALGRADAEQCWDRADFCLLSAASDMRACMQPVEAACTRTAACDR